MIISDLGGVAVKCCGDKCKVVTVLWTALIAGEEERFYPHYMCTDY